MILRYRYSTELSVPQKKEFLEYGQELSVILFAFFANNYPLLIDNVMAFFVGLPHTRVVAHLFELDNSRLINYFIDEVAG